MSVDTWIENRGEPIPGSGVDRCDVMRMDPTTARPSCLWTFYVPHGIAVDPSPFAPSDTEHATE